MQASFEFQFKLIIKMNFILLFRILMKLAMFGLIMKTLWHDSWSVDNNVCNCYSFGKLFCTIIAKILKKMKLRINMPSVEVEIENRRLKKYLIRLHKKFLRLIISISSSRWYYYYKDCLYANPVSEYKWQTVKRSSDPKGMCIPYWLPKLVKCRTKFQLNLIRF